MTGRYPLVLDSNGKLSELPSGDYPKGVPWGFGFDKDTLGLSLPSTFLEFACVPTWVIPASIPNGIVLTTGSAPGSTTDIDLQVNSVSVGTIRFAASTTTATFIKASDTTVSSGQIVKLILPSNMNGLNGRLFGSIVGFRT